MEAPSLRHIGTNDRYHKSVGAVVVAAVAKAMLAGCVVVVTVLEEVNETEEGEGAADEVRG